MTKSIKLGDKVQDKISDFEGIVSAKCDYLHGTSQLGVTPVDLDKNGKKQDSAWFEEEGLKIID